jgi:hypothetical protein
MPRNPTPPPSNQLLPPDQRIPTGPIQDALKNIFLWGNQINAQVAALARQATVQPVETAAAIELAINNSGGGGSVPIGFSGTITVATTATIAVVTGAIQSITPGAFSFGDVFGPASAGDGNVTLFDGITGKLIKDGGTPSAFVSGAGYWTLLTNSDPVTPELIFAAGDVISVWVPA